MAAEKGMTVRINPAAHRTLRELAVLSGESMPAVLDKAIEEYRKKRFWEEVAAGYDALRSDPAAWQEELEERAHWERALGDGLDPE